MVDVELTPGEAVESVKIEKATISFLLPRLELINTSVIPKGDLKKTLKPLSVNKVRVAPTLLDLIIGKFWISWLEIEGTEVTASIKSDPDKPESKKKTEINLSLILQQVPISEAQLSQVKLHLNIEDQYKIHTESLNFKAYNKKSSLIVTLKEPELNIRKAGREEGLSFLIDSQLMLTKNTLSLSKLKVVKDDSFFLASGNARFSKNFENVEELQMNTRIKSSFPTVNDWVNRFDDIKDLEILKGNFKTDIDISKNKSSKDFALGIEGQLNSFQIEKVILGDLNVKAQIPNENEINVSKIDLNLSGGSRASIENAKVNLGEETTFTADVNIPQAQLHSFLRDSQIADIPVWLGLSAKVKCEGSYKDKLNIVCPGEVKAKNLKIQNASRTKTIVKADKVDIAGEMTITEKAISYKATAAMPISKGESEGVISFEEGFNIKYTSPIVDFEEVGPIADLNFKGQALVKGTTKGSAKTATFSMDVESTEFDFEDYYFGSLNTNLGYRSGNLYLKSMKGDLESTRFNGQLNINLKKELISGDIQLPFFRMEDVQQAI
ncbi:MAG: hypothetical protein HRT44_12375, partial [Bdellovibrionales bacterium]|nr:hypothetical protein [Bdellovibrionales bacterium]NQZ20034.1 hypothetical protein [Bdellovibrionales bacterium]